MVSFVDIQLTPYLTNKKDECIKEMTDKSDNLKSEKTEYKYKLNGKP